MAAKAKTGNRLIVDRAAFDAILGKLIASPPKPATPKRKARNRAKKTA